MLAHLVFIKCAMSSTESEDSTESCDSDSTQSDIEEQEASGSDDETLSGNSSWSDGVPLSPPFVFVPTEHPGLAQNFESELQCFKYFFSDEMTELVIRETNNYAKTVSRSQKWEDLTKDEFSSFLGLCLIMGSIKKPAVSDYWTEDSIFQTPIFSRVMSRNRFQQITSMLHFNDNAHADASNPDSLHKIRPVLDLVLDIFQTYTPSCVLSIDELLQKFKGRLRWRQYIPSKRARYGMKIFVVCESSTSYIYNFIVYTGKDTLANFSPSDLQGRIYMDHHLKYFSTKLVLSLTESLKGKGYVLVLDNFFMSIELCRRCIELKFDLYGTINKNRKELPKDFIKKTIDRGELQTNSRIIDSQVVALFKYCDPRKSKKKVVHMISTVHDSLIVSKTKRNQTRDIPQIIHDYNHTMGGVDRVSQVVDPMSIVRRSTKWYKKLFFMVVDFIVNNSFVVFSSGNPCSRKAYFSTLVHKLLACGVSLKRIPRSIDGNTPLRLLSQNSHFLKLHVTGENRSIFRRCSVCSAHKIRKDTKYICQACGGVPLCATPCFEQFHTKTNF